MKTEQKRLANLYAQLKAEVGSSTMDLVDEIVELEIKIESHINKCKHENSI